jgi:hypothetical protein
MGTFFVHANEPGLQPLLDQLDVPHGTELPTGDPANVVIGWGLQHRKQSARSSMLNPPERVGRCRDGAWVAQLLELNGVSCLPPDQAKQDSGPGVLEYRIPVFHLEALAVFASAANLLYVREDFRAGGQRFRELAEPAEQAPLRKLMREAVKAVYALGLDYALVHALILPGGSIAIANVDPAPQLDQRLAALFAQAIARYDAELRQELQRQERALLGADPEFILRQQDGRVKSASKYMGKIGQVGCDALILPDKRVIFPLAELRPDPCLEPKELVRSLYRTMRLAARKITDPGLEWLGGGMPLKGFPLGGHLHLSRIWLNSHLLRALDNYLALPLALLEPVGKQKRRPRFGFLGDFRRKSHGGFEYRTPPSWLLSPRATKGVFALTRLIADHYRELPKQILCDLEMQRNYYEGNREKLVETVREIWCDLRALPDYLLYRDYLDPFAELIFRMRPWNEQKDFRPAWSIPPFSAKKAAAPGIRAIIE